MSSIEGVSIGRDVDQICVRTRGIQVGQLKTKCILNTQGNMEIREIGKAQGPTQDHQPPVCFLKLLCPTYGLRLKKFQSGNSLVVYIFLRARGYPGSILPASFLNAFLFLTLLLSFSLLGTVVFEKTGSKFFKTGRRGLVTRVVTVILISWLGYNVASHFHPRGNPFWTKRGPFSSKGRFWLHASFPLPFFPFHPRGTPFWTKRGPFSSKKGVSGFMLAFPCLSFLFTLGATLFEQSEVLFRQKRAFSGFMSMRRDD